MKDSIFFRKTQPDEISISVVKTPNLEYQLQERDEIILKESQRKKVLAYLKNGNKISQRDCAHMFNAWRLSAIIYDLRKDGHNITTTMVKSKNARYGEYSLS